MSATYEPLGSRTAGCGCCTVVDNVALLELVERAGLDEWSAREAREIRIAILNHRPTHNVCLCGEHRNRPAANSKRGHSCRWCRPDDWPPLPHGITECARCGDAMPGEWPNEGLACCDPCERHQADTEGER